MIWLVAVYLAGALVAFPLEWWYSRKQGTAAGPLPGCATVALLAALWPVWAAILALALVCGRKS